MNNHHHSVLLVDDQEDIRECLRESLEDKGFQILEAENGRDGWLLYKTERPDLIITDFEMPIMDGHKLARNIRAMDLKTYIVLCTNHEKDLVTRAMGFYDKTIQKPFYSEDIQDMLIDFYSSFLSTKEVKL